MTKRTKKPFAISLLLIFGYSMMLALVPTSVVPVDAASDRQAEASEADSQERLVIRSNSSLIARDGDKAQLQ